MKNIITLFLLFKTLTGFAQITCNDWLELTQQPSSVQLGDLDVPGDKITVEAIFNRTTPYSGGPLYAGDLVSKHLEPADVNYLLRPNSAEITTTNGYFFLASPCEIKLNTTYHVALVYDGSMLKYYRNGFLMAQRPASGNLILNDWKTCIGYYSTQLFNTQFVGYIDEVRIWNVARTQAEIRAFNFTSLPSPASQPGLQAYLTFDNISNKQGNVKWNGTQNGILNINALNPACSNYSADSCCTPPEGTLYGSIICKGKNALLKFISLKGIEPFKLIYTDGTSDFTATNVYSGVDFPLTEVIKNTKIFNLKSIQDASGCPPVVIEEILTGINLVNNGDFNVGNMGFSSEYNYSSSGIPPSVYYVAKSPNPWHPSMPFCTDHTNQSGNMMLVNGSEILNTNVWTQTINVKPNTIYKFSTWVQNISTINPAILQFSVNGIHLGSDFNANISSCVWDQFYTTWYSGNTTTAKISIINKNTGFAGNDFALDDISFASTISNPNSAIIEVKDCITDLCSLKGALPVVDINFGSGQNPGASLPAVNPAASTTYQFSPVSGNPALPTTIDGQYTITNNIPYNSAWFVSAPDHTPGDTNGYMAFYNASPSSGEFYSQKIDGLCSGMSYEFSAWIANVLDPAILLGVKPDITFRIELPDGSTLASLNTGNIAQSSSMTWKQYGLTFTTPLNITSVLLKMENNNPGGYVTPGNDLAIDDITFRACLSSVFASFDQNTIVDSINICSHDSLNLYGSIMPGYNSPEFMWQESLNAGKTWLDFPNSNKLHLKLKIAHSNFKEQRLYRLLVAETGKINSVACRATSNLIKVVINTLPDGFITGDTVCKGTIASLTFTSLNSFDNYKITYADTVNNLSYTLNSVFSTQFLPFSFIHTKNTEYTLLSILNNKTGCKITPHSKFSVLVDSLSALNGTITFSGISACEGGKAKIIFDSPVSGKYNIKLTDGNQNLDFLDKLPGDTLLIPISENLTHLSWVSLSSNIISGCSGSGANLSPPIKIISYPSPLLKFDSLPFACINNPAFKIIQAKEVSGIAGQGLLSGVGLNPAGDFNPATAGAGKHVITFTFISDKYCIAKDSGHIRVNDLPDGCILDSSICEGNLGKMSFSATKGVPPFKISYSDGSAIYNVNNQKLKDVLSYPVVLNSSRQITLLSISDSLSCIYNPNSTSTIFVRKQPQGLILSNPDTFCLGNEATFTFKALSGKPSYNFGLTDGTSFSYYKNVQSGDQLKINVSQVPFQLSFLTLTDSSGLGCTRNTGFSTPIVNFKNHPQPVIVFNSIPPVCANSPSFIVSGAMEINGLPGIGTYSGTGLDASGNFDPSLKGPGQYIFSYEFLTNKGCFDSKNQLFTVLPIPQVLPTQNITTCKGSVIQLFGGEVSDSYKWFPTEGLSNATVKDPYLIALKDTTYILEVSTSMGCKSNSKIKISLINSLEASMVPNAFTPNGDGLNDTWDISDLSLYDHSKVYVFNRWGNSVFKSEGKYFPWNSNHNNQPLPASTYYYIIEIEGECEQKLSGSITIIR